MAELFSQVLDLKKKDVFLETQDNDTKYFSITGLPSTLSYGKHPFSITFNDPEDEPLLKNLSNIVFEFVDSRGTVIFSNLIDIEELSGAGNGFIWIKKDPLRTADEIADGPAFLYVMGELDGEEIPNDWKGIYNVRTSFTYDIRKDFPNTSPLVLAKPSDIQTNLSISETVEFDDSDTVYKRSFINVTLSDLETNGGKIESVELAYNEQKSKTDDFDVITSYPLTSGSFETDSQTLTSGLNPITNTTKIPTPKTFRRNTPVKFRLRFLSPSKQLAQYLDKDRQGEIVEVTSSFITFDSAPFFVEKTDNLLTGSLSVGREVGKGFTFSGKKSAELSTVDYKGFTSASLGLGPGILMYSGSVKDDITDDYALGGVGLELVANSESFFRFRTNPSELDIRANAFFIGSETTSFVSSSGGNIEISSSNFHLTPEGNVTMSGEITAEAGTIGGFTITDSSIEATNIKISSTAASMSLGDKIEVAGGTDSYIAGGAHYGDPFGIAFDNDQLGFVLGLDSDVVKFEVSKDENEFLRFSSGSGLKIGASTFTLVTSKMKLDSATNNGKIALGSTPPTAITNNKGFYADGNGTVLIGDADGSRISFDNTNLVMSASTFFLGGGGQFISGSNGNIEISSSNFHLQPDGDVIMSGTVTATAGEIGGFTIESDKLISEFVDGVNQATASLETGNTARYRLISKNSSTSEVSQIDQFLSQGAKGTQTIEYQPEGNQSQNAEFSTFAGSAFKGLRTTFEYNKAYGAQQGNINRIQIDMTSGSKQGIDDGVTLKYISGSLSGQTEIFRLGKIGHNNGVGNILSPLHHYYGISGSSIFSASFGYLEVNGTKVTSGGGGISNVVEDTTPQLGGDLDLNSNDITGTGNIDIVGNITAQNFIVSSSVTSIEYQSLSGSTIFGDSADDTHTFLGNTISGSSTSTGSFGHGFIADKLGIGTTSPTVGLQLGVSTSGLTKTAIFNSEGGGEVGLKIQSRTNRAKLRVADNDTSAYVVAEGGISSFGPSAEAATTNISVLSSGNVGIGKTNPDATLHIASNSDSSEDFLIIEDTDTTAGSQIPQIEWRGNTTTFGFFRYTKDGAFFRSAAESNLMHVSGSGQVGIGTTSPSNKLTVEDTIGIKRSGVNAITTLQMAGSGLIVNGANGYHPLIVQANGTEIFRVKNDGNISGSSTSTGSFGSALIDGFVGIGTKTPRKQFHSYSAGGVNIVGLFESSDSQALIAFRDNSTGDDNHVMIGANGTSFAISTDNTQRVEVDSSGNVTLNSGVALEFGDSNTKILGSSVGNYLGFTPNGTELLRLVGTSISGSAVSTGSFGAGYIDNKLGVGTVNPKAPIHIFEDNYSTVMADPIADTRLFVSDIDGGSHIGIQSKNDNSGSIYFGHRTEIEAAKIVWDNSTDSMNFYSGSTKMFRYGLGDEIRFFKLLNSNSSIVTLGGIHVGGTSDPGNDNLTVDGIISGSIYDSINVEGTVSASGYGYFGGRVHLFGAISIGRQPGTDELTVGYDNSYNSIQYGKPAGTIHKFAGTMISGSSTSTGSFGHLMIGGGNFTSASLAAAGSSGISDVVDDTSPQLGGDLDLNSNDITGTGNINITGNISGSATSTGSFGTAHIADNLGIGTTSPAYPLHITGADSAILLIGSTQGRVVLQDTGATSNSQAFDIVSVADKLNFRRLNDARSGVNATIMSFDGDKVGIGTDSPDKLLHLYQTGNNANLLVETDNHSGIQIKGGNSHDRYVSFMQANGSVGGKIGWDHSSQVIKINAVDSFASTHLVVDVNGKVGIGTDSPGQELEVIGEISASSYIYAGDRVYVNDHIALSHDGTSTLSLGFDSGIDKIRYGKQVDDVHEFFGDTISGSSSSTGSFGSVRVREKYELAEHGDVFTIKDITNSRTLFSLTTGAVITLGNNYGANINLNTSAGVVIPNGTGLNVQSGNISGSATSTGSFGQGFFGGNVNIGADGDKFLNVGGTVSKNNNVGSTSHGITIQDATAPALSLWDTTNAGYHSHFFQVEANATIRSSGNLTLQTNAANTALTIDTSQKVGIGNTAPPEALTVQGDISASGDFHLTSAGNSNVQINVGPTTNATDKEGKINIYRANSSSARVHMGVIASDIPISGIRGLLIESKFQALGFETPNSSVGHIVFSPKGSEKVRIAATGEVGIGTTSPGVALEVIGSISGSAASTGSFGHGFIADKLGIGTTAPERKLHVVGNPILIDNNQHYEGKDSGGTKRRVIGLDSSNNINIGSGQSGGSINFIEGDATHMSIDASGNVEFLTASTISGSATSTGSFGELIIDSNGTFGGDIDLEGDIDVNGTTNLDNVDIDGTVQIDGNTTFGVSGTGVDVRFYGDTAGRYISWNESADQLKFQDNTKLVFGTSVAEDASDAQIYYDATDLIINNGGGMISLTDDVKVSGNISGSSTSTGSFGALRAGSGSLLELGDTTFAGYVGMKTGFMGSNDYMIISGISDGNTYISAKDTKSVEIRGGGNRDSNKIVVPDNTFIQLGGSSTTLIRPSVDNQATLGTAALRFSDVFAVQTTTGGVFETGLRTEKIGDNPTGTIVSWEEDGLVPCDKNEDELVMGVIKKGKDEPIVLGAEPVLVTGKVNVGDYIVTSDKIGHGKSVKRGYLLKKDLFGKVIAQALESCDGDSNLIKCMIRKM